jgi:hypothetical protein
MPRLGVLINLPNSSQLQLKISKNAQEQSLTIPVTTTETFNFSQHCCYSLPSKKQYMFISVLPKLGLAATIANNYVSLELAVKDLITLLTAIGGIVGAIGILFKWKPLDRFRKKKKIGAMIKRILGGVARPSLRAYPPYHSWLYLHVRQ